MHRRLNARDAFPKSTEEYAQQVEQLLQHRRAELNAAWEELEEGWTANNERMAEIGLSPRTSDEGVVKLNVGGSNVRVCWDLFAEIEGFGDSVLGALLEGVWGKGRIPRDADGRIVLDESPACIKLIMHTMLRATSIGPSSSVAVGLPESATSSAVAIDEVPCLIYTADVMGLPGYVPMHPKYMKVKGGSTILESFGVLRFGALIREWVGSSTDEMTLIYRATRDGFSNTAFKARCNTSSPKTIFLVRVSLGEGNADDSVVGGYSVHAWGSPGGGGHHGGGGYRHGGGGYDGGGGYHGDGGYQIVAKEMLVFMLKDGSATPKDVCKPTKWKPTPGNVGRQFVVPLNNGLYFGTGGLVTTFDATSGSCTVQTRQDDYFPHIASSPSFLALNGKKVVDIEVYRCSAPAPPTTTAPSITKPGGGVLTDAEPQDIRSVGESIASSLMEERVVLDRAVKEMGAAGARVSAAFGALETVYGPSVVAGEQDAVVELNVRGTRMTTLRSTLQACSRSALATMFDAERWPATGKDKDEHGRRLIDCNPTCFSKILDVLRMRKRASWNRGAAGEKQEGSPGKCSGEVCIKNADLKAFGEVVNMYFPGCESFVMDLVQPV